MEQKFSFYNFLFAHQGKYYLYNLLSTSIIEIDENIYLSVKNNDVSQLKHEYTEAMRQEGFIVDKNTDESLVYKYYYDSARFFRRADSIAITLVPTYNCNLSCPYCYQGQSKSAKKMSLEHIQAVIKFVENQLLEGKGLIKSITCLIYGGEPLLCKQELVYYCSEIKRLSLNYGAEARFAMTSNMTLLDSAMLDMIRKYQINVQVSIDGTKDEHDKRRIYKNGKGTYDVILSNIKKLYEAGLKHLITIRLNVDKHNVKNIEESFCVVKDYSDDIYVGQLREYGDNLAEYKKECVGVRDFSLMMPAISDKTTKKYKHEKYPMFGKQSPCYINSKSKFFVDTYLNVYKCDLLLNQPECRVGTLDFEGNFHKDAGYYQQMAFSPFEFEKCRKCKLLPLCGAGCPGQKYGDKNKKDGNIMDYTCSWDEEMLLVYLKNYVEHL